MTEEDVTQATLGYSHNVHDSKPNVALHTRRSVGRR